MRDGTAVSSGVVTTGQLKPVGTRGMVTYMQCVGATILRDGTAAGKVILSLTASGNITLDTPVRFVDGLHVTTATDAVVHIG